MRKNFLESNFSIEDAGYACLKNDRATINHTNSDLQGILPRSYRWSTVVQHFPYFRFYLITEGSMRLQLDRQELILEKGNMYFLPPLSIKGAEPAEYCRHYFTHFHIHSLPYNFFEKYCIPNCLPYDEQELNLNQTLLKNFKSDSVEADLKSHGSLLLLLSKFFRDTSAPSAEIQRFYPVLNYIDRHICEPIQIEKLARIMHLSKIYFVTVFSQTFNISPMKFIIEKRMLLAQELLLTTDLSVREIADRLGYENEYYFSTVFKRVLNISPSKWRQLSTNGEDI